MFMLELMLNLHFFPALLLSLVIPLALAGRCLPVWWWETDRKFNKKEVVPRVKKGLVFGHIQHLKMTSLVSPLLLCFLFHLEVLSRPPAPFHPETNKRELSPLVAKRCVAIKLQLLTKKMVCITIKVTNYLVPSLLVSH